MRESKLTVYTIGMRNNSQVVVIDNINTLLNASRAKKKDLAEYMGKVPQSVSKMLSNKQSWFYDDVCAAADFFGVDLGVLAARELTISEARDILKAAASKRDDGQLVAGHGFEPWTSGL